MYLRKGHTLSDTVQGVTGWSPDAWGVQSIAISLIQGLWHNSSMVKYQAVEWPIHSIIDVVHVTLKPTNSYRHHHHQASWHYSQCSMFKIIIKHHQLENCYMLSISYQLLIFLGNSADCFGFFPFLQLAVRHYTLGKNIDSQGQCWCTVVTSRFTNDLNSRTGWEMFI